MRALSHALYRKAYGKFGIGAFNIFNAEQIHGVFRGAEKAQTPVIIQITPVAREYINPEMLRCMIDTAETIYPEVEFTVHLDHGNYAHCFAAIEEGAYNSIMIDASHESFEENIRITSEVVKAAHAKRITVEAELGILSGVEDGLSVSENNAFYTNPAQAQEFVKRTGCDSLAVAVGTSHGAYKFSGGQSLQIHVLERISQLLPGFPLVLHGASAVPTGEVGRINQNGGALKTGASGLNDEEIQDAIRLGVCKINIATDMRLIWTRVHREFFSNSPELFDMVIPGRTYMNELAEFVCQKCKMLNTKPMQAC